MNAQVIAAPMVLQVPIGQHRLPARFGVVCGQPASEWSSW